MLCYSNILSAKITLYPMLAWDLKQLAKRHLIKSLLGTVISFDLGLTVLDYAY